MKFKTKALAVAMFATSLLPMSAPVQADGLMKDDFRARVVDYCLFEYWRRARNGETKGILPGCRCAAKGFMKELKKEELSAALETGALTRAQKKVVLTKYAVCRK